ncbi:MAG TPA: hypothetical protein VNJ46_03955, partial [Gaiellaceae bacterium]|nr:hypothetical protein [Gaiellaceae bacterium]
GGGSLAAPAVCEHGHVTRSELRRPRPLHPPQDGSTPAAIATGSKLVTRERFLHAVDPARPRW